MVKHFNQEVTREEFEQVGKINAKAELLRKIRRRELVKDTKRSCIKRNIEYKPPKMNIYEYIVSTSEEKLAKDFDETAKEVHSYKVALHNAQNILKQLEQMKIANERPADYLVEMYKSDKQMFKVRRYLTEKEEKIKEKMQGKDWEGKNKRREKKQKIAEAKRAKKKDKLAAKRNHLTNGKPKMKMTKVNGKNKKK